MQKLIMAALLTFSAAASAGYHFAPEVYASWYSYRRTTYGYGYGSVAGAAASADESQYISCSTTSYTYDGTTMDYGYCTAVDKDWNSASCYTTDASLIRVMGSINETSTVNFSATDGVCTYLGTTNGSLAI